MTRSVNVLRAMPWRLTAWRWTVALCLGLLAAAALPAAAGSQEPQEDPALAVEPAAEPEVRPSAKALLETAESELDKAAEEAEKATQETKEEGVAAPAAKEPEEEREWLVDEDGKEYYVVRVPKAGMQYLRLSENRIRGKNGEPLLLAGEDEDYFFRKIFKVTPIERPKGPTEEELAALVASYEVTIGSADAIELLPFSEGLPEYGLWRHVFDVADMNGDGHLDIVHGTPRKTSIPPVIFLGDSAGHWTQWKEVSFPPAPYDYGAAVVADWNGDGIPDLGLGMHATGLLALVHDGQGVFRRWSEGIEIEEQGHRGTPAYTSRAIAAVDWNVDGRPDILALAEGPRNFDYVGEPGTIGKVAYLNQGDGTWVKLEEEEASILGNHVLARDMNGDGRVDLVTASSARGYRRLINVNREDVFMDSIRLTDVRRNSWIDGIAVDDWDGDGRPDLAYSYVSTDLRKEYVGIDVLFARDEGAWERLPIQASLRKEAPARFTALGSGDLDGDGHADLAATTDHGQLLIFRGTGGGFVREEEEVFTEEEDRAACQGYHVMFVDLDDDGADEILANFSGESCRKGNGGSLRAWKARPRP